MLACTCIRCQLLVLTCVYQSDDSILRLFEWGRRVAELRRRLLLRAMVATPRRRASLPASLDRHTGARPNALIRPFSARVRLPVVPQRPPTSVDFSGFGRMSVDWPMRSPRPPQPAAERLFGA